MSIFRTGSSFDRLRLYWQRTPLLPLTASLAGGVLIADSCGLRMETLLGIALLGVVASAIWDHCFHRAILASVSLLVTGFAVGAGYWNAQSLLRHNDLRNLCVAEGMPARLRCRVVSSPEFRRAVDESLPGSSAAPGDQTRFNVSSVMLETEAETVAFAGDCRVFVSGLAGHVCNGDEIRVVGSLSWPRPPGNPGQFDYARYLTHAGIHGLLFVNTPSAVEVTQPVSAYSVSGIRGRLRRDAELLIRRHISPDMQPTAEALLLGHRGNVSRETKLDLIASGTMHLLAISGLHLGILFLVIFRCCRLLVMSHTSSLVFALVCCMAYSLLTDVRPSMLRAVVFLAFFVLSQVLRRDVSIGTLLSLSILLLIVADPGSLFGVGTWLSMLSVIALAWATTITLSGENQRPPDTPTLRAKLLWWPRACWWHLKRDYIAMASVMLFNAPVVASQFHVISPTGLALNIILIWPAAIVMTLGFLFLASGLLFPFVGGITGFAFDQSLQGLIGTINAVSRMPGGHLFVARPSGWLLAAYFGLLAVVVFCRPGWWRCGAILAFCTSLVTMSMWTTAPIGSSGAVVRCSVLDVGHGAATLIESSDGRTILIDCGAINRGERAADILCDVLWYRGHRRLDAIVISHPDADHLNALRDIVAKVPTGQIVVAEYLMRSTEHAARFVREETRTAGIPLAIVQQGDTLHLGQYVSLEVLHPPPPGSIFGSLEDSSALTVSAGNDNANSITLLLEISGQRICIPGDLEGPDQLSVMQRAGLLDVLISPHHGSRLANSRALADVTRPRCVVASCRDTKNKAILQQNYGPQSRLFLTCEDGAVTLEIAKEGTITGTAFRSGRELLLLPLPRE